MEEPNQPQSQPDSSSTTIPAEESRNGEFYGAASVSASVSQVLQEEQSQAQLPSTENEAFTCTISDDSFSCIIVIITFCFLVSIVLVLGVYGSLTLRLGSNCSLLIKANPVLVKYLKVKQFDDTINGSRLYGFYKDPPLDVLIASSELHSTSLPAKSQKDWIYFLNEGSQLNIYASVNSPSPSPLVLVIADAEGIDGLVQWLDDTSYSNTTFSWNILHGNGMIQQDITKSSNYYVSVANLNSEILEIQLNLTIRALVYNTSKAYYNCSLAHGECSFTISFTNGNAAVLTTPGTKDASGDGWYVELSYGPRWITYLVGIGGTTVLMFLAFHLLYNFQHTRDNRTGVHFREMGSERASLLSHKDDGLSSRASSYDSVSQNDEDLGDGQLKDCAICFAAPRNCFFLPCGHCVACFACGTRIADAAGTCPICRRNMKKVRKIFLV